MVRTITISRDELDKLVEEPDAEYTVETDGVAIRYVEDRMAGIAVSPIFTEEEQAQYDDVFALRRVDVDAVESGRDSIPFSHKGAEIVVE